MQIPYKGIVRRSSVYAFVAAWMSTSTQACGIASVVDSGDVVTDGGG
jgi:hypothetical protein